MSNDELSVLALEARILSGAMMRLVRNDLERRMQPHGIGGWLQFATMALLRERHMTISELSKQLRVEPATLVPVVDALERDGLAKRGTDPNDRRRTPLSLTDHGAKMMLHLPVMHDDDMLLQALRGIGVAKSRQFVELLRELMKHVSQDEDMVREVGQSAARQIASDRAVHGKRKSKE